MKERFSMSFWIAYLVNLEQFNEYKDEYISYKFICEDSSHCKTISLNLT